MLVYWRVLSLPEMNSEFAPRKWMLGIKDFLLGPSAYFQEFFLLLVLGGVE